MLSRFSKVGHYMTKAPHSIEPNQSAADAKEKMIELGCKHLPVLSGGNVVGILSDRDLLAAGYQTKTELKSVKVGEVMIEEVIQLDQDASIADVVKKMKQNKVGSILITENKKLLGIFTETDAIDLFENFLEN